MQRPDITSPTCSTWHSFAPVAAPTCSDHFQPGSYVARPIVILPIWTSSNFPLSNLRTSSGFSKRFKMVEFMVLILRSMMNVTDAEMDRKSYGQSTVGIAPRRGQPFRDQRHRIVTVGFLISLHSGPGSNVVGI